MKTRVKGILIFAIVISSCVLDTAAYVHQLNPRSHHKALLKSASKYAQHNEHIANGIITGGLTIAGLYALLKRIPGVGEFLLKIGLLFKASTGQIPVPELGEDRYFEYEIKNHMVGFLKFRMRAKVRDPVLGLEGHGEDKAADKALEMAMQDLINNLLQLIVDEIDNTEQK